MLKAVIQIRAVQYANGCFRGLNRGLSLTYGRTAEVFPSNNVRRICNSVAN